MAKKRQNRFKEKAFTIRVTESQYNYIKDDAYDNAIKLAEWFDVACAAKAKMTLIEWRKL